MSNRFLSKDFLSGLLFIIFGLVALYFGQRLALGTPIRMGPGYVPRMLSLILLCLGSVIVMIALWRTAERPEKERWWLPLGGLSALVIALSLIPWGSNLIGGMLSGATKTAFMAMPIPIAVSTVLIFDVLVLMVAAALFRANPPDEDFVETPAWRPITMVTIGVVCFALLFERAGLIPALVVLILIASLGGEEFKVVEVIGNMVVLAILCTLVFKVGLGMNITILRGVW
ncbi:MAG TPA: tripartite tricarboxylate transporter TctB family protein [Reyranellaceae bacterium]|nr:tripartite tricarboxylate transporter TctB family protein [Reyranellaceae bacterium]